MTCHGDPETGYHPSPCSQCGSYEAEIVAVQDHGTIVTMWVRRETEDGRETHPIHFDWRMFEACEPLVAPGVLVRVSDGEEGETLEFLS